MQKYYARIIQILQKYYIYITKQKKQRNYEKDYLCMQRKVTKRCQLIEMERKEFETEAQKIRAHLHRQAVRYLQNTDDAEDVTQDVLLKLWCMRLQLEEYNSIEALALVITKHLCLNRLRLTTSFKSIDELDVIDENDSPEASLIKQDDYKKLMTIIDKLPDVQQATLRMKHIDGLETNEIARITGCEEVTVRTNLSRARKKIKELFIQQK